MQGPAKVTKQVGDQSVVEVVDKSVDMKDSVKAEDLLDQVPRWSRVWLVTRRRWWLIQDFKDPKEL